LPIYIVKDSLLRVSLVRAPDESVLELMLDQIADTRTFEWKEYRGPLWITLYPPVKFEPHYRKDKRPMAVDEFELKGIESLATQGWRLDAKVGDTEEGSEMEQIITNYAFPTVGKILSKTDPEGTINSKELENSIKADLISAEWRRTNRRKRTP
jgi:hypothetical protein